MTSQYKKNQLFRIFGSLLVIVSITSACGFQTYQARPIDPEQSNTQFQERTFGSEAFRTFLLSQNYPEEQWPIQQWRQHELILCALFFHPDLDLARAEWRAAVASETTAGQKPELGVSGTVENHSKKDGGVSPWTLGLGIDVPIETAGKRSARIDRASQLSEAMRLEIAQTAWQVRSRVVSSLIDLEYNQLEVSTLQNELSLRQAIADMLQKRLSAGMASSVEMSNARLALQKTQQTLEAEKGRTPELRSKLASHVGLPLSAFNQLNIAAIKQTDFARLSENTFPTNLDAQQNALLNRLDIRAALARYAASEAKLRLEIARQYPDVMLSPSYTFDQDDHIWSLGFSSLLTLVNKNRGLIEEARALREVEAAKFESLQATVISDLSTATARLSAIQEELKKAYSYQYAIAARIQQTQRQFNAGLVDRLELTTTQLENVLAEQNILNVAYKMNLASAQLENIMQLPISGDMGVPDNLDTAVIR